MPLDFKQHVVRTDFRAEVDKPRQKISYLAIKMFTLAPLKVGHIPLPDASCPPSLWNHKPERISSPLKIQEGNSATISAKFRKNKPTLGFPWSTYIDMPRSVT